MASYKIHCKECSARSVNGTPVHESNCSGSFIYTDAKGRDFQRWAVFALDVWGNARDGFEINDRSRLRERLLIPCDASNNDYIRALKSEGLLNKRCHFKSFRIDGDDRSISIDARKTGEPIYQLEVI